MESTNMFHHLILATLTLTITSMAAPLHCPDCGKIPVPYPLSTESGCGDQAYKIRCSSGTLWFDALNQSSYLITFINPSAQRLIVRPPGLTDNDSCISADFQSSGMLLDHSLPFNITPSNTIIKLNCSPTVQQFPEFCTSSSGLCQTYLMRNKETAAVCSSGTSMICCSYSPVPSLPKTSSRIKIRKEMCSMYTSFVNLDPTMPVSKWPEPGVELQWTLPHEPLCTSQSDCNDLLNSTCSPDPVKVEQRRCFCSTGSQWDPINGQCQGVHHSHVKSCKPQKAILVLTVLASVATAILTGVVITIFIRKRRQIRIESLSHVRLRKALEDSRLQQHW